MFLKRNRVKSIPFLHDKKKNVLPIGVFTYFIFVIEYTVKYGKRIDILVVGYQKVTKTVCKKVKQIVQLL